MTGLLASVSNVDEALLVESLGADIIDLKNPLMGALGAIAPETISTIVDVLNKNTVTSATIGDLPLLPELIVPAVQKTATTGIDFIKIGLFDNGHLDQCLTALQPVIKQHKIALIGVLFADQPLNFESINALAISGFRGVMLDTSNKSKGSLNTLLSVDILSTFISTAGQHNLLCGLAGSLRLSDIETLTALNPDYLGFRGALCNHSQRTEQLNPENIRAIRNQLSDSNYSRNINRIKGSTGRLSENREPTTEKRF
jgi:dihydroneopterin aldolase